MTGVAALDEFAPIYRSMGALGWSPPEVDAMEVWQVADFLGDDEAGREPVIRGARSGLRLPSDKDDDAPAGKGKRRWRDRSLSRRMRSRDPGVVLTGDDAR